MALETPSGFERCVRGSVRELYGYVALLTGRDRAKTEALVTDVYRSLFRAAAAGQLDAVRLSSLRSAGRRLWLDRNDAELARPARLSPGPVRSIAELSVIERAVVVLRHVNGMSDERAGDELGRPPDEIAAVTDHAVRRLRGTTDTSGAWVRAYFDDSVAPRPGLVDRIVAELGPRDDTPADLVDEATAVDEPTMPIAAVAPGERDDGAPAGAPPAEDPPSDSAPPDEREPDAPTEPLPVVGLLGEEPADDDPAADEREVDAVTEPLPVVDVLGDVPPDDGDADGSTDGSHDVASAGDATDAIERSWRELSIAELGAGATAAELPRDADAGDSADERTDASTVDRAEPAPDPELPTAELPATGPEARSAGTVLPTAAPIEPPPTRRWWPIALVAVLAVALFAAWWWFGRDDGSANTGDVGAAPVPTDVVTTTPSTGSVAPTTVGTASTVPPTTADTGTPTTVPPAPAAAAVLLDGETSDRYDPECASWYAQPTPASPALPATFGPLGASPAVSISIPDIVGVGATVVEPAGDGLLVGLLQSEPDGTGSSTLLARVGIDGVVHWVRCYDETLIVVGEPNGDLDAAVGRFVDGQLGWYLVSMADGDISDAVDPVTELALNVIYERGPVDPAGPTARWEVGVLTGFDADGNVIWTDPEVSTLSGEGFVLAVGDDLAIANVCDDEACERGRLRAYDLETGELVWEREGARNVAAVADGYALIGLPGTGWELVETADGQTVPGQTWTDPDVFTTRCCGEGERWFTERIGGVVVAARPDAIDLWLPADASDGTVAADLAPPA